jgi:hypothetical protein
VSIYDDLLRQRLGTTAPAPANPPGVDRRLTVASSLNAGISPIPRTPKDLAAATMGGPEPLLGTRACSATGRRARPSVCDTCRPVAPRPARTSGARAAPPPPSHVHEEA